MSNRKTTLFYALLIALASLAVGMTQSNRRQMVPEILKNIAHTLDIAKMIS